MAVGQAEGVLKKLKSNTCVYNFCMRKTTTEINKIQKKFIFYFHSKYFIYFFTIVH